MAVEQATRSIPITKPVFGLEEMAAIQKPLESGWVVQGPYVKQFEDAFCAFTGAPFAVATSSCTTALHIAVAMLGVKPGDEVIVPAFTWVSTANVVEYMGATPVFCDIDLQTFNIDVGQLSSLITERTVGIIPVHLFGLCADIAPIMDLARRRHLWVVEDAACGLGGWYHGTHAGLFADAGCFSFHPRKSITTGEGGMITTARPELDRMSRSLRDHGASRTDFERHQARAAFLLADYNHLGFNFRMTDIQGALGCVQMERAPAILAARTEIARRYDALLAEIDWLEAPFVPEGYVHGYQAYVGLYRPEAPTLDNVAQLHEERNAIMAWLEQRGIATRPGTHAAFLQGYYVEKYGFRAEHFPNAYIADRLSLTLPLYPQMTADDQEFVVMTLRETPGRAA
jgi:dTDP-4-amino-4,6-dideoxygalactose transaminase